MKINVKVIPNSSQEKIEFIESENIYKVWTHAKAIDNEANKNVTQLLAKFFNVSKAQVKLIWGQNARNKTFEINK
ncbi:MAG: DUF167 domain-containing protein [Patescibacteria group bacterium]|nr:DUF167 domain-containing protein [Patescibacteria group bacterium]